MENALLGLQNVALVIKTTLVPLLKHYLLWGFVLGFGTSTMVHLFIISDNPRNLPAMITKDASQSFIALSPKQEDGTYSVSYTEFQKEHNRVRIAFYSAAMSFFIVIAIAFLRF